MSNPTLDASDLYMIQLGWTGAMLGCTFFGVYAVISITNVVHLIRKKSWKLLVYVLAMFLFATTYTGINMWYGQVELVLHPYTKDALSTWPNLTADVLFVVNAWLADGLLLHRCFIIWDRNKAVLILPLTCYIVAIGSSISLLIAIARTNSTYSTKLVRCLGLSYGSLSLSVNIIVSVFIVGRLLYYRRMFGSVLGSKAAAHYGTLAEIVIESAALYTTFGLITLGLSVAMDIREQVFYPSLNMLQAISPNLIIYWVALGRAYRSGASVKLSDISFSPPRRELNSYAAEGTQA